MLRTSRVKRSSRPATICCSLSVLAHAAASSIASGIPSSPAHNRRSTTSSPAPTVKSSRTRRARSTKRATASSATNVGSRQTVSPGTPSGSRLVTSTVTSGHDAISASTASAAPATTCSQLSRHTRTRRSRKCWASDRSGPPIGSISTPTPDAMTLATVRGSLTAWSSIHHTPSRQRSLAAAAWAASRVLPDPPAARDRDQSLTTQELVDCSQFGLTADESRQFDGQVVGDAVERTQRR